MLLLLASGEYLEVIERYTHVCNIFSVQKLANSNLMQVYIKSLIQFGSTRSKLLMFLNWSQSICGWTIL